MGQKTNNKTLAPSDYQTLTCSGISVDSFGLKLKLRPYEESQERNQIIANGVFSYGSILLLY